MAGGPIGTASRFTGRSVGLTEHNGVPSFRAGAYTNAVKTKRKWLLALLVAVIICATYLFWQSRPDEVSVAPVRRGTAVELVYATGFVEPEQPVQLQADRKRTRLNSRH